MVCLFDIIHIELKGENSMGQFSWITCDTKEQVVNNEIKDVYVLIPKEFGKENILEQCYDGYGNFGNHDIYDLVADWNKNYITIENLIKPDRKRYGNRPEDEEFFKAALEEYEKRCKALEDFKVLSDKEMEKKYGKEFKRKIGISIACYNEQNAALKYPIKIARLRNSVYEECSPSDSDHNQGWREE